MNTTTARPGARPATKSAVAWSAAAGLAGAGVIITFGNLHVANGEQGGLGPAIGTGVLCLVLAAAVFGLGVPRWRGRRRPAIVLGVLTVASLAVFWSGAVAILAAAAVCTAPRETSGDRTVKTALTLAVAAAVLAIAFTVVNFLA